MVISQVRRALVRKISAPKAPPPKLWPEPPEILWTGSRLDYFRFRQTQLFCQAFELAHSAYPRIKYQWSLYPWAPSHRVLFQKDPHLRYTLFRDLVLESQSTLMTAAEMWLDQFIDPISVIVKAADGDLAGEHRQAGALLRVMCKEPTSAFLSAKRFANLLERFIRRVCETRWLIVDAAVLDDGMDIVRLFMPEKWITFNPLHEYRTYYKAAQCLDPELLNSSPSQSSWVVNQPITVAKITTPMFVR
jgi:hypothetical protein